MKIQYNNIYEVNSGSFKILVSVPPFVIVCDKVVVTAVERRHCSGHSGGRSGGTVMVVGGTAYIMSEWYMLVG